MGLSHVVLKRCASLWRRCGEFWKSNWRKNWSRRKRRMFLNWAEQQLENDSEFYWKIIFSDEAHLWLNDCVNKQNMRYWSDSNPHVLHESSLLPEKISVWWPIICCTVSSILWPNTLFKNSKILFTKHLMFPRTFIWTVVKWAGKFSIFIETMQSVKERASLTATLSIFYRACI